MAQMQRPVSWSPPQNTANYHQERIKIRAFYLRLTGVKAVKLPSTLTLVYLPRIDGISAMEVNGSKVHSGKPGIVSLDRVRSNASGAVFASTDRVRAGNCARFEAYVGDEKVVNGVFRKGGDGWKIECRCTAEEATAETCEVCVVGESGVVMKEKVDILEKVKRRHGRNRFHSKLDEIPEESEDCELEEEYQGLEIEDEVEGAIEEEDYEMKMDGWDEKMEMEKIGWAVDVGLWVACLGVGLLAQASFKSLKRRHFF